MGWWCKHQECTGVKLLQYDAEDDYDDNIYADMEFVKNFTP